MDTFDYLIIGGGVAGTTAAETIRRRDPNGSIAIVSAEPHRLYSRILLSKPQVYSGEYDAERLFLKTEQWYREQRITFLGGVLATGHDPHRHIVSLSDANSIEYGNLLLALGTTPHAYAPVGAGPDDVLQLHSMDDALLLRRRLSSQNSRVVSVGKGFISFEAAWITHSLGAEVTVLNRRDYPFFGTVAEEQGVQLRAAIEEAGAVYRAGSEITALREGEMGREAQLSEGAALPFDLIVAGIGVTTPSGWLHRVDRTADGAVLVGRNLATNVPGVWAAGDGAVIRDNGMRCGNWAQAMVMGRLAGENMAGDPDAQHAFAHVPVFTTQGFGQMLAFVGDVRMLPGDNAEVEGVSADASVRRIQREGKLVGAVLLNQPQLVGSLIGEIEQTGV